MSHTAESTVTTTPPDKARRRLRWYQFSLRTLLVLVLLASVGMSWLAVRMQRAKRQREAVEEIRRLGGEVMYDHKWIAPGSSIPNPEAPGPAWLRKLLGDDFFASVTWVALGEPEMRATGLEYLTWMPQFPELYPHRTQVTDAALEHLKGFTKLRTLYLVGTEVTDAALERLKGLTHLQELFLGDAQVTDAGLVHLKGLTQLETLDLISTEVTDAGLEHLKGLTLRQLYLTRTHVTDAGLEHLKELTGLRVLLLSDTKVSDAGLEHLRVLPQLRQVSLERTHVTDAGVKDLQEALPNVRIYH